MNKDTVTMLLDLVAIAALVILSLGIWYYPWITVVTLALLLLTGCLWAGN